MTNPRVEAAAQAMAEAWGYEWTTDVGCHQALGTGQDERPTKHDFREGAKAALAADVHHRERLEDTIRYLAERHHDTIRNSKLHDPENRTWQECDCKPCKRAQEALGLGKTEE